MSFRAWDRLQATQGLSALTPISQDGKRTHAGSEARSVDDRLLFHQHGEWEEVRWRDRSNVGSPMGLPPLQVHKADLSTVSTK